MVAVLRYTDLKTLRLAVVDRQGRVEVVDFRVEILLLGGWSGRNIEEVMKHIEELEKIGVPRPRRVPALYPVSSYLIDTYNEIQVQHPYTNGEVEYVLFVMGGDIKYVTVGSDHTDRELERLSVAKAKQAYPKIVPPVAWRYEDVADHWDELILRSWIRSEGREVLYQNASLKALITPDDLLRLVKECGIEPRNLVVFSETIPAVSRQIMFGDKFRIEMEDPVLGRRISYEYRIRLLPRLEE